MPAFSRVEKKNRRELMRAFFRAHGKFTWQSASLSQFACLFLAYFCCTTEGIFRYHCIVLLIAS